MKEAAKQLKQRYSKIPMFMIYLFLLVNSRKFISTFMKIMLISGIISMILCIILCILQMINNGSIMGIIVIGICTLLLIAFIKDLLDRDKGEK